LTQIKLANDYDDRGARAVYSVLLEMGQVLGAYRDRFVLIGGSVGILAHRDHRFWSIVTSHSGAS